MKRLLFSLGVFLLFAAEILRIYFIMPFPGSQQHQTLGLAYFIGRNIWLFRLVGLALVLVPVISVIRSGKTVQRIAVAGIALFYFVVFFFFNFRFEADKMFRQPRDLRFAGAADNQIPLDNLIIGVDSGGEAKAYPIQLIGYHHQVRDSAGQTPVMITYCTVCRTGRVYRPLVNGVADSFRLVGMDYFNAMFEDSRTKSWWQQATGVAVAGPLTGTALPEWPSRQMTLRSWFRDHPGSLVMQRDTSFNRHYDSLKDYDKGLIEGDLEKRDSISGSRKSWVVGIVAGQSQKAYDWNLLTERRVINDEAGPVSVLIYLENDTVSYHAWNRVVEGKTLWFEMQNGILTDTNTRSTWSSSGQAIGGPLFGRSLQALPAYQEFFHSWTHFHPRTELFKP